MCVEHVGIALCAPAAPPSLTFTCGKIHLVAKERVLCDNTLGACICFFGTCGIIEKQTPTTGIDFSDIKKLRCADCATREDNVGDRRLARQILETPLLQRAPVNPKDETARSKHFALLGSLWGGQPTCPFHKDTVSSSATSAENVAIDAAPKLVPEAKGNATPEPIDRASCSDKTSEAGTSSQSGKSSMESVAKNGLERNLGLSSSRWADKPTEPKVLAEAMPVRRVPSPKFERNPAYANKVRDATQKLASVKAFLGKLTV